MYQIPALPVFAALAFGAAWWGRGRTGDVIINEQEAIKAYKELCEAIPKDSPISAKELAVMAGEAMAPDMHWPPRFLASRAHKNAWKYLLSWATTKAELAQAEGKQLCEVILPKEATPLRVTFKANPVPPPGGGGGYAPIGGLSQGQPSNIAPSPTPGRWSKQVPNLGLLASAGQAYGLPPGAARLAASKVVNFHPFNKAYAKYKSTEGNAFNQNHYAPAILSYDGVQPIYYPTLEEIGL